MLARTGGAPVMRTRSGSGDHSHKSGTVSEGGGIRRSVSDSSLFKKSKYSYSGMAGKCFQFL